MMGWIPFFGSGSSKDANLEEKAVEMSPDDETSPLVGSQQPDSNRSSNWALLRLLGIACAVLLVAFLILDEIVKTSREKEETARSKTVQEDMLPEDTVLNYRPFCNTYSNYNAKIIQTSLGQPSQQWTPIPCFPVAPQKSGILFGTKPVEQQIDFSFGYPDAILQVNFTQTAFPNRSVPILGFGGAFTEAAALNYNSLSQKGKDTVMELLFGETGLGYSLGRVHINSVDFSVESYSFDETDGDFDLEDFDVGVHHDVKVGMVEMMLRATTVFRRAWGSNSTATTTTNNSTTTRTADIVDGHLQIFASPWSPPAWMKAPTPDDKPGAEHAAKMTNSAQPTCLREGVGPHSRYARAWAKYFAKFLTACEYIRGDVCSCCCCRFSTDFVLNPLHYFFRRESWCATVGCIDSERAGVSSAMGSMCIYTAHRNGVSKESSWARATRVSSQCQDFHFRSQQRSCTSLGELSIGLCCCKVCRRNSDTLVCRRHGSSIGRRCRLS
jgi:hypothetical protein